MSEATEVESILDGLMELSPAGYAIGLHLSFTTSKYIFQNYPKAWMEEYSQKGLILNDPTVRWGLSNEGSIRWSELSKSDDAGVITAAASYGLTYGVSISVADADSRSLGSFASADKEFSEAEIERLSERLLVMHNLTDDIDPDSLDDKKLRKYAASLSGF